MILPAAGSGMATLWLFPLAGLGIFQRRPEIGSPFGGGPLTVRELEPVDLDRGARFPERLQVVLGVDHGGS